MIKKAKYHSKMLGKTWESAIILVAKWFILHLSSTDISIGVYTNEKAELV